MYGVGQGRADRFPQPGRPAQQTTSIIGVLLITQQQMGQSRIGQKGVILQGVIYPL